MSSYFYYYFGVPAQNALRRSVQNRVNRFFFKHPYVLFPTG